MINYECEKCRKEVEIEKIEAVIGDCEEYELSLCHNCYSKI